MLVLYPIEAYSHAETMIVAHLPAEGILINADMFVPGEPGASYPDFRLRDMRVLGRNIERLDIDVARHVGLHGGIASNDEFLRAIAVR